MEFSKNYYPLNAFRICADKIEGDVGGRIFCPLNDEGIQFCGMTELLVMMDEMFDRAGYPQAFQDKRSFEQMKERRNLYRGIPKSVMAPSSIVIQKGKHTTFDVLVHSRKNTSWQGEIYDEDGNFLADFDGEIQLMAAIEKYVSMM